MKLCIYYEPLGENWRVSDEMNLIYLWRQHHERIGFKTVILGGAAANKYPDFVAFDTAVSAFPQCPLEGYNRACFRRWAAMAGRGGGVLMDYDCFIYDPVPFLKLQPTDQIATAHPKAMGFLIGTRQAYADQCEYFAKYKPAPEERSVDDMTCLQKNPAVTRMDLLRQLDEDGWGTAPAVHYSFGAMNLRQCLPRYIHIPRLRQ